VKIITIAQNTFSSFLRDKLIILFSILFACVVLLMMTPLLGMKAMTTAGNAQQMQSYVLSVVAEIMSLVSGCGSLLAAWAAADTVASEVKSGTILAVMARPVRRWEFLAGKYLGVLLLMTVYIAMMFGLSYLLAWMGGEKIQSTPWVLVVYPLVRYAIYGAIAMLLVTVIHPVLAFAAVMTISVAANVVDPAQLYTSVFGTWVRNVFYVILPSTTLLSEERFLVITHAALKQTTWVEHLITLAYGLDYALVCLLLAMWSFHSRTLKRD
jgi:ABC-type transport system involved in multi-copper enzyme maturation permease subunit